MRFIFLFICDQRSGRTKLKAIHPYRPVTAPPAESGIHGHRPDAGFIRPDCCAVERIDQQLEIHPVGVVGIDGQADQSVAVIGTPRRPGSDLRAPGRKRPFRAPEDDPLQRPCGRRIISYPGPVPRSPHPETAPCRRVLYPARPQGRRNPTSRPAECRRRIPRSHWP